MFIIYERTLLSTDFVARKCARISNCQPRSAKVLGLQWFREEANIEYWRANSSGRGLGSGGRRQIAGPSRRQSTLRELAPGFYSEAVPCELCPSGSLILLMVASLYVQLGERTSQRSVYGGNLFRREFFF